MKSVFVEFVNGFNQCKSNSAEKKVLFDRQEGDSARSDDETMNRCVVHRIGFVPLSCENEVGEGIDGSWGETRGRGLGGKKMPGNEEDGRSSL